MRVVCLCFALLSLTACWPDGSPDSLTISGETMGTIYNVTVVDPPREADAESLGAAIEAALAQVNGQMNNWDPSSDISEISASDSTAPMEIAPELATVLAEAMRIHRLSDGKFDVTLAPLIDLWGFGPKAPGDPIPSDADIAAALDRVGQAQMLQLDGTTLTKTVPGVSVNLAAIAKGYGVDAIAAGLEAEGATRYLVEIGGDLAARGLNADDQPWSIGIERPDAATRTVEEIVPLSDRGLATSGDYRNYFEEDGVRYSHILDPTTGRPITHRTASVTVIAESAKPAAGLATAMLVLGGEAALQLAAEEDIALMVIDRAEGGEGGFVTSTSPAFDALVQATGN